MVKKPNVVLITIDALRADHLGFMGYGKNTSPRLDQIAKEGAVFSNAYSVGPVSPHSFPSILSSTYPLDFQGPRKMERPRVLLSEILKEQGFVTAAFHSSPYLSNYFGYNRGWDFFEDLIPTYDLKLSVGKKDIKKEIFKKIVLSLSKVLFNISPEITFRIRYLIYKYGLLRTTPKDTPRAQAVNQIINDFLSSVKDGEAPFFFWVHYMDIHGPYLPLDAYFKDRKFSYEELVAKELPGFLSPKYLSKKPFRKFIKKHIDKTIDLYDEGIRYIDQQVGDLINSLKEEKIYENTVIIVAADHGDEFLEHGGGTHSTKLYNELLHVPLLVKLPGGSYERIDKKVSLIDLVPTVCDYLKIKKDSSFKGRNLFGQERSPVFHQTGVNENSNGSVSLTDIENIRQCQIACQSDNWKYIFNYGNQREELYDLAHDPKEQKNVSGLEPQIICQMRKKIKEFEKENPPLSLIVKS